jgi:hypothetical protein
MNVGFPIWRRPSIFMDVAMWEHRILTMRFLDVAKFTNLTPLSLLIPYIFELVCYIKTHFGELHQNIAVHNHNTRQKLNLHVQFCRTNVYKNGVMNMGIRLYFISFHFISLFFLYCQATDIGNVIHM